MFRRRKSKRVRDTENRTVGRRSITPPELLEPRHSPGGCLQVSWLTDPITNGWGEAKLGQIGDVAELRCDEQKQGQSRRLGATSEKDSVPLVPNIEPYFLADGVGESTIPFNKRALPKRAHESTGSDATQSLLPTNGSARVQHTVSEALPSVADTPVKAKQSPENVVIEMTPPPAATSTGSESGGGGGSSQLGGGGSSGSGRAAEPAAAIRASAISQSAAAVAASATAASAVSPEPQKLAAASSAPATSAAPSSTTAAVASNNALVAQAAVNAIVQNNANLVQNAVAPVLSTTDVQTLLDRASAATARNDAIIAVVDRNGRILGVRVESGVAPMDTATMVFAIDGALAKARSTAFFSNSTAPLTSRTVRFISQSTITEREVASNPNSADPTVQGPGFVAPIGLGGHFPPDVSFTPHVDLFAIEHTNRDVIIHPGKNGILEGGALGTDDVNLVNRFGIDQFADGKMIYAPESYGTITKILPTAQLCGGIATLPGGVPLFKKDHDGNNVLVGGIGVFFPGPSGFATFEQGFVPGIGQTTLERTNAPLVKEAEYTAFAAAGGVGAISNAPALPGDFVFVNGRIDLAGITLEIYGPNPGGATGLANFGRTLGTGVVNGTNLQVTDDPNVKLVDGLPVAEEWIVNPKGSADGLLTEADVRKIITDGIAEADRIRSQIRLPIGGRTRMIFCVVDLNGEILGLYRMKDALVDALDVTTAKARNAAYYADAAALQPVDQVQGVPAGAALTGRTFRYLASPFFPTGFDPAGSGPFSSRNDSQFINPQTAENIGPPRPEADYKSILLYDAFNPYSNFHELDDPNAVPGNQNGAIFFPGSSPLYKNGRLVGGLGVSGDGVDQNDTVTYFSAGAFLPQPNTNITRADETFVRGIRIPFIKFGRNLRA